MDPSIMNLLEEGEVYPEIQFLVLLSLGYYNSEVNSFLIAIVANLVLS